MTKQAQKYIKESIPYFGKIDRKYRYKGPDNAIKDKAWSMLSDYCRQRDWIIYGTCISSGTKIEDWKYADPGHFHNMGAHGAELGFHHLNIHLQSKYDNMLSEFASGKKYQDELVRRYGESILGELEAMKHVSVKADDFYFIKKLEETYSRYQELKEKYPDFEYPAYL